MSQIVFFLKSFVPEPFKNVKAVLSLQTIEKQGPARFDPEAMVGLTLV